MKKRCGYKWLAVGGLLLAAGFFPSSSNASIVANYRFEGDLAADSGANSYNLTSVGTAHGSYALPGTGAGSAFPSSVLGNSNTGAVKGSSTGDSFASSSLKAPAGMTTALNGTSTLTLEAFVNVTSSGGLVKTISALGGGVTDGAWTFGVTSTSDLFFQYARTSGAWGANQLVTVKSGYLLTPGNDYYVGMALNETDASENGLVFYVQDLTAGTDMQAIKKTRLAAQAVAMYDTALQFQVGNGGTAYPWKGVLDEVRVSDAQLAQNSLMIPEPSVAGLLLVGGAGVVIFRKRMTL